ncbi:MAG: hypothetical protein V3T81_04265 [Thermoanaerobaculia bacterium]
MKDPVRHGRLFLRAAGVSAWILSGTPGVLMVLGAFEFQGQDFTLLPPRFAIWLGAAIAFAIAFWITSGAAGTERPPRAARLLLLTQSAAA